MLLQDIRYALRTLLRNKGFTAIAVACLSLGIGVNATIFSVVDGVILNPYPYPESDRIIVLHSTNPQIQVFRTGPSYPDFKDWRDATSTIEAMAGFQNRSLTVSDGAGEPERFAGLTVSWQLFGIIGAAPAIGRGFGPDDDRPGAEPVVMLSDDVWRIRYASDPGIVGRAISVNGRPHTVIGVMSLVLLVGASLFMRSFLNLQTATLGFDTAPLMTMRFYLPGSQYEAAEPKAQRIDDIVRRVETLPGVEAAFASNFVPIGGGGGGGRVAVEGKTVERGREPVVGVTAVTPHFRRTLGIELVRGRDFTDSEGTTRSPVALVNQAMADRLWPGEDPIGRRFRLVAERDAPWLQVIGVLADFRHFPPQGDAPPAPNAYRPLPFEPTLNTGLTIRVAGDPARIAPAVREQIRASDPLLPVFDVRSMEEQRLRSFWQQRLFGLMFATFGAIALLLASIGVYGVLSYSVSQRTQEIGVRVALGAERRDVMRLIVGHGLRLAAAGVLFGLAGAFAATRVIRTQLYNVTATDPASFAGVAVFLTAMAFLASYFPARRATAVDPIVALRND